MKKILPLLLLNLMFLPLISQEYDLEWAFKIEGEPNRVAVFDIETDSEGNLIAVGYFSFTVDFDPSGSTSNLTSTSNINYFVSKYDPNGNLLWARTKDINSTAPTVAHEVHIDVNDNIYVSGGFSGEVDLDMTSNQLVIAQGKIPLNREGVFLLKLNKAGDYKWAWGIETRPNGSITIGGGSTIPRFNVLSNGEIIYSSIYEDSIDVDFTANQKILKTDDAVNQARFVMKCDTSMNFLWAQNYDCISFDGINDVLVDSKDNYYILGNYNDSLNLNPAGNAYYIKPDPSGKTKQVFIAKYSTNGLLSWGLSSQTITGTNGHTFIGALDEDDDLYVFGRFYREIGFDPSSINNRLYTDTYDYFSAKINNKGLFQWQKKHDLGKFNRAYSTLNPGIDFENGNLFFSLLSDTIQWDMDDLNSKITSTSQSIARFNKNGEFETLLVLKITNNLGMFGMRSLEVDADESIHQVVSIDGEIDMDPSTSTFILNSQTTFSRTSMMMGKYSFKYLGVQETNPISLNGIDIFPNPAGRYQKVHIKSNTDDITEVKIYNLTGQKIKSVVLSNNIRSMELDIHDYSKGVYLLKISTKSGTTSKRLVITE